MLRFLAIFSDNYGGEFDVNGFKIMTLKEVEKFEELAGNIAWDFSYGSGNESLYYTNGEDLLSRIEFKEITKEQFDILNKLFDGEFGTFIGEDYLHGILYGENDHDEDDEDYDNL